MTVTTYVVSYNTHIFSIFSRPLPDDMLQYARSDTHFLLYIFDNLRNALLDRGNGLSNCVQSVLDLSAETCLRTYTKDIYDIESGLGSGGWNTLATKWNKNFNKTQMAVFRAVHAWRDQLARQEDESVRYLPSYVWYKSG